MPDEHFDRIADDRIDRGAAAVRGADRGAHTGRRCSGTRQPEHGPPTGRLAHGPVAVRRLAPQTV
ncbi:hypothetical protein JBE04_44190 [Streptomyces sp. PRKS01-29]|nr:hypothetical protein [Streptomyces sabulosicollis]MBI0301251.1 hypothetical protein [Streptomyces sabulosicollis]